PSRLLAFRRVGAKVVAEYENPRFRAVGAPAVEQASARDAFAPSMVWGGEILSVDPQGRILIDVSSFLTQDALGVVDALKGSGESGWSLSRISVSLIPVRPRPFRRMSSWRPSRPSSPRRLAGRWPTSPRTPSG
ncbi:MAG: hypothetical protein Q8S47_17725, partial [Phenylobacterium sp.]|nr:hypothetical protein [Phenylobacterium sp.]